MTTGKYWNITRGEDGNLHGRALPADVDPHRPFCTWCPNPESPDPWLHPDGQPRHVRITEALLIESAWGVIANAGWDGDLKSPGWQEAAERWRDRYHSWLSQGKALNQIRESES